MGVKDLWKILEPAGRPISPEMLQGLILSVDVSIWLNQALKGARDNKGYEIPNAHLLVLFNRICKLLYYRIKPVFVFDGPAPPIKAKTLESRKRRKLQASKKASDLIGKGSLKILQAHAIQSISGKEIHLSNPPVSLEKDDLFYLPPVVEEEHKEEQEVSMDERTLGSAIDHKFQLLDDSLEDVDIDSETFTALPLEMQHDLLLEKKEANKHNYVDPSILPEKAVDFSDYQLMKVMKRSHLNRKLEDVRKNLNLNQSSSLGISEDKGLEVEANRIASSEERHYILIRGKGLELSSKEHDLSTIEEEVDPLEGETDEEKDSDDITSGGPTIDGELPSNVGVDKLNEAQIITIHDHVADDNGCRVEISSSDSEVEFEEPTVAISFSTSVPEPVDKFLMISSEPVTLPSPGSVTLEPVILPSSEPVTLLSPEPVTLPSPGSVTLEPVILPSSEPVTLLSPEPVTLPSPGSVTLEPVTLPSPGSVTLEPVTLPSPEPAILPSPEPVILPLPEPVTLEQVILPSSEPVTLPEPVTTLTPAVTQKPSNITINEEALKEAITETNQLINLPVSEAESILRDEADNIRQQVSQQERRGAGVTSLINKEAQELLKLFGLPYIESPSEAEAQCAMLESLNLTQGTITDDNDVFLFGGSSVYRHVFSSDRDLMSYSMQDIKGLLGLDRNKLILLAYLLGSDYTDGIDGIGCVHATEMIQCFNGDGLEPLINMRNCQMEPHQSQSENALFKKIKRVTFPTDFPQENVKEAYINPSIDNSTEPFEWGRADLDLIREYTSTKFGWSQANNDKKLLPVLKRANEPIQQQTNISTYFAPPQPLIVTSSSSHKSKRLRNAVTRLTGKSVETKTSSTKKGKRTNQRKRKADTDIAYPVTSVKRARKSNKTTTSNKKTEDTSSSSSD